MDPGFGDHGCTGAISIMDAQALFQVDVNLQSPPISPLSLGERVRVRAVYYGVEKSWRSWIHRRYFKSA
jgi:hypothetical protein